MMRVAICYGDGGSKPDDAAVIPLLLLRWICTQNSASKVKEFSLCVWSEFLRMYAKYFCGTFQKSISAKSYYNADEYLRHDNLTQTEWNIKC